MHPSSSSGINGAFSPASKRARAALRRWRTSRTRRISEAVIAAERRLSLLHTMKRASRSRQTAQTRRQSSASGRVGPRIQPLALSWTSPSRNDAPRAEASRGTHGTDCRRGVSRSKATALGNDSVTASLVAGVVIIGTNERSRRWSAPWALPSGRCDGRAVDAQGSRTAGR